MSLERVTNFALLVACLIAIPVLGRRFVAGDRQGSPPPVGYAIGDTIKEPPGVAFSRNKNTVVLFLASKCKYCEASMPFYKALSNQRVSGDFQLVALGLEPATALADVLRAHGVEADYVGQVQPGDYRGVLATPTLLVVDRAGRAAGAWRGQLSEREAEVRNLLN